MRGRPGCTRHQSSCGNGVLLPLIPSTDSIAQQPGDIRVDRFAGQRGAFLDGFRQRLVYPGNYLLQTSMIAFILSLLSLNRALPTEQLLPQNIRMATMLCHLTEHVEIYPAQRKRAAPVALNDVVDPH